ncbi:hypothetical protein JD969_11805 [Planctomycetota bacterium]|nr:hypothetical protein JD969_11805 [Planctomycetota bacterium]
MCRRSAMRLPGMADEERLGGDMVRGDVKGEEGYGEDISMGEGMQGRMIGGG